jgi:hypothetical protein
MGEYTLYLSALKLLLLNGNPLELKQTKWLRSLVNATIHLRGTPYNLVPKATNSVSIYSNFILPNLVSSTMYLGSSFSINAESVSV